MKTITNQEFAEKTNYKYQTVRRWSRDIFGIDPTAGQASGVAREYTLEKAFLLYLAAHLINQRKVSIPDTKKIIEEIKGWLRDRQYFPLQNWRTNHVCTIQVDGEHKNISHWRLIFLFHDSGEICIKAIAEVHGFNDLEPVGFFEGDSVNKEYRVYKEIISNCDGLLINTVEVSVGALILEFLAFFGIATI